MIVVDELYLDILLKEYDIEMSKKQSLETRSGLLITMLCALSIFIFDKISFTGIGSILKIEPLTNLLAIKFITGILVYIAFISTLIISICIIGVRQHNIVNMVWKSEEVVQEHSKTVKMFIKNYMHVVDELRKFDNLKAKRLRFAYKTAILMIVSLICYISI